MKAERWLQTATILCLSTLVASVSATAQSAHPQARLVAADSAQLTASGAMLFAPAQLGSSSPTATLTFTLTGSTIAAPPTVALHYGREFALGTVSCAPATTGQLCSVPVTFAPSLPGLRPDALFVTAAGQRVATVPLTGTGLGPMLILQGNSTAAASLLSSSLSGSIDAAVVDENGTAYLLDSTAARITAVTAQGQATVLPITGLVAPRALLLDGAGVLYILDTTSQSSLVAFDTVQGLQRSVTLPVASRSIDALALHSDGTLAAISESRQTLYASAADGSWSATPLQQLAATPGTLASRALLASGSYLASSADSLLQVTASGGQSRLSSATTSSLAQSRQALGAPAALLGVDAAGTLYQASAQSTLGLAAPTYSTAALALPAASAIAADGSLYLAGNSSLSHLSASSATLDLGNVQQGSRAQQLATLYNAGNQPLQLSSLATTGLGFSVQPALSNGCIAGNTLAPGATCGLAVTLEATQLGSVTGSLSLTTNSLNQSGAQQSFTLIAHAVATSQTSFSPTSLTFPSTTVNVASTPLPIILSNTGGSTLNISSIALIGFSSGSYSQTNNCGTALNSGSQCTINVTFTPLATGTLTASLSVVDDQGGVAGSTQTVTLTGTGTPAPAPNIMLTPKTLSFGSGVSATAVVVVGTASPTQTVVVSNTGNATANFSSITLTTALTVQPYSFTTTCGSTLAAGSTCTVTVGFLPPTTGTLNGTILFADDATGTPQPLTLTGIGTAGDFNLTSTQTSLTLPRSGGSGTFTMTATPDPAPFPTPVVFTAFGVPAGATYNFNPGSISPTTAAATGQMNIQIPPYVNNTLAEGHGGGPLQRQDLPLAALLFAGIALSLRRRRLPWLLRSSAVLLMAAAALGLASLTGCTGAGIPLVQGVAPGTYLITVTGQSANGAPQSQLFPTVHYVSFNLIVQ